MLHLGDYIYEYGTARPYEPARKMLPLADRGARHAFYKQEPDLWSSQIGAEQKLPVQFLQSTAQWKLIGGQVVFHQWNLVGLPGEAGGGPRPPGRACAAPDP